ncbi:hypothetical protein R5R35_009923 [Gryllus longicercus]|uniref:Uncharacterized protein n=1 Tax=Gryllus longicercus TaxID=2509291 RepID=A0AAN9VJI3_9ORTH
MGFLKICESSPSANFDFLFTSVEISSSMLFEKLKELFKIAVSKWRYQVGIRLPRGNIFLTSGRKSSFKEQGEEKEENHRKYALKRKVSVQVYVL